MAAHLQEAAIVSALATNENRVYGGLRVVIDAARAGALEERKCPIVGVEHHLLCLARILSMAVGIRVNLAPFRLWRKA
jgi:hypothetical protein